MFPWRLEYPDPDTNYKTTKLCFFTCKEYALIHIERHKIKRKGKMPHNGYRAFNNKKLKKFFPNLKLNSFQKNLIEMIIKSDEKN